MHKIKISLLVIGICAPMLAFGQLPTLSILDNEGDSSTINITSCTPNSVNMLLRTQFDTLFATANYKVDALPYQPVADFKSGQAIAISGLSSGVAIWQNVYGPKISLPFNFCFYDQRFSNITISENGIVSFGGNLACTPAPYYPNGNIPSLGMPYNSIFGVHHNMINDPDTARIRILTQGTTPNRLFVISFDSLPQSDGGYSSSQIVLHETTNIIDIYIKNKEYGRATMGLQNYDGTKGISPAGRNTGNWAASNEGWRFTPTSIPDIGITWFNMNGDVIGTGDSLLIPTPVDGNYSARVTFGSCSDYAISCQKTIHVSGATPVTVYDTVCAVSTTEIINLTDYEERIIAGASAYTFSYHRTLEDAINNSSAIASPTTFSIYGNKTVYVRICDTYVDSLMLTFAHRPNIAAIHTHRVCDTNVDHTETFALTDAVNDLAGYNAVTMSVKFFQTQADAEANNGELSGTYTLTKSSSAEADTLYARLQIKGSLNSSCYTITKVILKLCPEIQMRDHYEALVCYARRYINSYVNLTQYIDSFYVQPSTATIQYYTDAACTQQIINPANAFLRMNATVYIKASATDYCDMISTLDLFADYTCNNQKDGIDEGANNYRPTAICDAVPGYIYTKNLRDDYLQYYLPGSLTMSDITIVGYYTNAACTTPISNWANYSFQTDAAGNWIYCINKPIYVRYIINALGCEASPIMFYIRGVAPQPVPSTAYVCDIANDSTETIYLLSASSLKEFYAETFFNYGITLRFFDSWKKAQDFRDELTNSGAVGIYTQNTVPSKWYVVYDKLGCRYADSTTLELTSLSEPQITIQVCDFDDDQADSIRFSEYITNFDSPLSAAQQAAIRTRHYYKTRLGAHHATATDRIVTPTYAFNGTASYFYVRYDFENTLAECPIVEKVNIQWSTACDLPQYTDSMHICDTNDNDTAIVNLTESIIAAQPQVDLSYYHTYDGAINATPAQLITTPTAVMVVNNANFYIRVSDTNTGCITNMPLNVRLFKYPKIENDTIYICDLGNDGTEITDKTEWQAQLISRNEGLLTDYMTYSFHNTQADAEASANEIDTLILTNTRSLWLRCTNKDLCTLVQQVTILFTALPTLHDVYDTLCINMNDDVLDTIHNIIKPIDYLSIMTNDSSDIGYKTTFYASLDGAENEISTEKINEYDNDTIYEEADTIFVRRLNLQSQCYNIAKLVIDQHERITNHLSDYRVRACGEMSMILHINLTDIPPLMMDDTMQPSDYTISYHRTSQLAKDDIPLTGTLTNYTMTQDSVVYIKFTHNRTHCYAIKRISTIIRPYPETHTVYCSINDYMPDTHASQFCINLDTLIRQIIVGEPNAAQLYNFTYYNSANDALNAQNAISKNMCISNTDLDSLLQYRTYVNVQNADESGCTSIDSIIFTFDNNRPPVVQTVNLQECAASDSSLLLSCDITQAMDSVPTTSNARILYFKTFSEAQNGVKSILFDSTAVPVNQFDSSYVRIHDTNSFGDYLVRIMTRIMPIYTHVTDARSVCQNDLPFSYQGYTFNAAGTYPMHLQTTAGCDSIVAMTIHVDPSFLVEIKDTICYGDRYTQNDFNQDSSGIYRRELNTVHGCDSIVILHLFRQPEITFGMQSTPEHYTPNSGTIVLYSTPAAYSYTLNGVNNAPLTGLSEGEYTVTVSNQETGCTSAVQSISVAKICPKIWIDTTTSNICIDASNLLSVPYASTDGVPSSYSIQFSAAAQAAGLTSIPNTSLGLGGEHSINSEVLVSLPNSLLPNIYEGDLTFSEPLCGDHTFHFQFNVMFSNDIIVQKWTDLLVVKDYAYNGGYDFVGYQWFKNGAPIAGETGPYLYVMNGLDPSAEYSVLLTQANGITLGTCPMRIVTNVTSSTYNPNVYPTLLEPQQTIFVHTPQKATATLRNIAGQTYSIYQLNAGKNVLTAPTKTGIFLLELRAQTGSSMTKIIVK